MLKYLIAYAATAVVFFAFDFIWLSRVAKTFYFERLGDLLAEKPNMGAAAAFYAVFIIGIVIFAVAPALRDGSVWTAVIYGALFGFFTYATYHMTNYATLRHWSLEVAMVDMAWGAALTGVSAAAGFYGTRDFIG